MAHDNFLISQQTNFDNNKLLRKEIFSIFKNKAARKTNNLNIKYSIFMMLYLVNNYYYVNDLPIVMNIK